MWLSRIGLVLGRTRLVRLANPPCGLAGETGEVSPSFENEVPE
jgi:hypothetical protein